MARKMNKSEDIKKILESRLKERINLVLKKIKSEGNILKNMRKV